MPNQGDVLPWENRQIRLLNRHQADSQIWVGEFTDGNHERRFLSEATVAGLVPISVGTPQPQAAAVAPVAAPRRRRSRTPPQPPAPQPSQPAAAATQRTCIYCRELYTGSLGTDHACATVERLRCPACRRFDPQTAPARSGRHVQARLCPDCMRGGKALCHTCGTVFMKGTAGGNHCSNCDVKPGIWASVHAPIGGPVIVETRSHRPFAVEIESYRVPSQAIAPRDSIPNWVEAQDGSIHPPEDDEEEVSEIVEWRSPPFVGDAGLETLRRQVLKIRDMGFRTNRTCSVHAHIDISDTSTVEREALHRFGTWIEGDIYSFVAPSRREVIYARPLSEQSRSGSERYKWLNIEPAFERHKTVEVRLHHGTVDSERIVEWLKVCLRIVERGLRLGTLPEKPNLDTFKLLDLTKYERAYWSEVIERFARRQS